MKVAFRVSSSERLLPAELIWIYPLAPFAGLLLMRGALHAPIRFGASEIVGGFIPFIAFPAAFHALYRRPMPELLSRLHSAAGRVALNAVVTTVVAIVGSLLVHPIVFRLQPKCGDQVDFAVTSVIVSWCFVFPSLALQSARNRAQRGEQQAAVSRQHALQAQLAALQARTNPHFFFNSINTVASLIADDPELAERTLERLADMFRYALDSQRVQSVTLEREIDMVRDYLDIESARFGDRLTSQVELDLAIAHVPITPLVLQPLVENAILHGIGDRRCGRVEVTARGERDRLVIEVRDDGPGPGGSLHRGTQTSLGDLGRRVRLAHGEGSGLALESAAGGGCVARLVISRPAS